jgi:phasin family protein
VAARTAVSATEAVSKTTTAAMDKAAAVTEAAVTPVVRAAAATKPTLTQGIKTMMKSTEDFVAFGQANMEAFVKSSQIWSAGVQELSKQIATSAKASYEESVSTFKAISTAKSVKEAMDLQSTFAKAALEKAMAESNKLTDASIKLTEQTLAPITARVTLAVETFGKAA